MPSFNHPSLLWALPLIGVPVLIHLINMMRQRRVPWAAMEFLLQSQKRNKNWVLLRQLLLLLLRMTAVAALVFMVAQPVLKSRMAAVFGSRTHHIVLLDDSFSMSDRWSGSGTLNATAFQQALASVQELARHAATQGGVQQFTLLRFSRAERRGAGGWLDVDRRTVDQDFPDELARLCADMQPSQLATGPLETLDAAGSLLRQETEGEARVVYLVSDFRAPQWDAPGPLKQRLLELNDSGTQLQLVQCVDAARPNLAIASLKPSDAIRAVGVAVPLELAITNFGDQTVQNVTVKLLEDGKDRPALVIDQILPGATATAKFETRFLDAGGRQVSAELPEDAVAADNVAWSVIDVPPAVPVLIIEGDPQAHDAFFLTQALETNAQAPTGIQPQVEGIRYLGSEPLAPFHAIYLLNVPQLEPGQVKVLEDYAQAGGGVAFFLGPRSSPAFLNEELYRGGEGLFPIPLVAQTELLVDRLERTSDLEFLDHPMFRRFQSSRNTSVGAVTIDKYFAAQKNWTPPVDSTAQIIARLRNGAPLIVTRRFGAGVSIAVLTTAGMPQWNDSGGNTPGFVLLVLEMQTYLSAARRQDFSREVGAPLKLELDPARYRPQITLATPREGAAGLFPYEATKSGGMLQASLRETTEAGVYDVRLNKSDDAVEVRRYAFNVTPSEGNLALLDGPQLATRLRGVKYDYHGPGDASFQHDASAGSWLAELLLYVLIAILIGEQILAYSASYHPAAREGAP